MCVTIYRSLTNNRISHIPEQTFKYNKKLQKIYLDKNPITSVSKNAFSGLPYLKKLWVNNTSIICSMLSHE